MASDYGVLGQEALPADTLTDVYEVPVGTKAILSTITVCNRSGVATTFRLGFAPGGEPNDDKHYVAFDAPLAENEVWGFTCGFTLSAGDVVRAYAGDATVSVNVFGEELTP